jgi:glycosyltransferase involved in cell wall biosynthesis
MRSPKISVCVPTYNRAPLLGPFLASILSQRDADFEVIVSDNCSTDGTREIIAACTDPRLRYHRNDTNIGPYPNMNRLLELARGEYVCLLHDDDLYAPDFLQRESEMLDRHPNVGMVHCAVHEIDGAGARRQTVQAYPTSRVLAGRQEFVRYLGGHNVCCSSVMARRALFLAAGPFDSKFLCADFLMWMKFALRADIGYVADPLLSMRVHPDNVTSWLNPARWHQEFMAILEEGFALGVAADPSLAAQRDALFRQAGRAQGRRFLVASLAAAARGDFVLAKGYAEVLGKLRAIGLPRTYALAAGLLANGVGQRVLSVAARVRRARARRQSESLASRAVRA